MIQNIRKTNKETKNQIWLPCRLIGGLTLHYHLYVNKQRNDVSFVLSFWHHNQLIRCSFSPTRMLCMCTHLILAISLSSMCRLRRKNNLWSEPSVEHYPSLFNNSLWSWPYTGLLLKDNFQLVASTFLLRSSEHTILWSVRWNKINQYQRLVSYFSLRQRVKKLLKSSSTISVNNANK